MVYEKNGAKIAVFSDSLNLNIVIPELINLSFWICFEPIKWKSTKNLAKLGLTPAGKAIN